MRNEILDFVFGGLLVHVSCPSGLQGLVGGGLHGDEVPTNRDVRDLLLATKTCRQIHAESKSLFFTLNTFHGYTPSLYRNLTSRLADSQLQVIQAVSLEIGSSDVKCTWPSHFHSKVQRVEGQGLGLRLKACLRGLATLRGLKHVMVYWRVTFPDRSAKWLRYEDVWKQLVTEEFKISDRTNVQIDFERGSCEIDPVDV